MSNPQPKAPKTPGNVKQLVRVIADMAARTGQTEIRLRTAIAGIVVGQMLPDGAVKGGAAMKLRLGQSGTRFTQDVDFARAEDMDTFLEQMTANLKTGWHDFTGVLVTKKAPKPTAVPADYIMQPFEIRLQYKTQSWCSVKFEVGHDELGDTINPPKAIAQDLVKAFLDLGLPKPNPVPLLPVEHQIAQKLHACTGPGNERAHDLVDLQQLVAHEVVNWVVTKDVCERLFKFRRKHPWAPEVTVLPGWESLYAEAADGLPVAPDVHAAATWANDLITKIVNS